jgi:hypothetical protein
LGLRYLNCGNFDPEQVMSQTFQVNDLVVSCEDNRKEELE